MISDTATIARQETALSNRVEDRVLMMDIDSGAYYELDQTGAVIWEVLEQPMTFEAICQSLAGQYDVPAEQCRIETSAFLTELNGLGLVVIS